MMARHGWQRWVALAAAYLFAIQTILVAIAQGAQAAPALSHDVFCYGAGASTSGSQNESQEPHQTCCSFACTMFAPALGLPGESVLPLVAANVSIAGLSPASRTPHEARRWRPGNPRAPPLAA